MPYLFTRSTTRAVATLVVSLLMTGITFFALNSIQRDAQMSDTRYARDLGLLLSANVTPLVAEGNDRELAAVAERFWKSSRSLRYIFFADPEGIIYLGIPISGTSGSSELLLSRRLEMPADLARRPQSPLIRQIYTGKLILNSDYTAEEAEADVTSGKCDAVSFGRPYISNPDLAERIRDGKAWTETNMATWYTPGPEGYTDYPAAV